MPVETDLSGLRVCVVACHFDPETTGSAPYNTALVKALGEGGADVEVVTGIPHYPQWAVGDEKYRRGVRWKETFGSARVTRVRHAVPRTPDLVGRARMELSFASLALPYALASRSDVVIAVTPLLGALVAGRGATRGRPLGVVVHDLSGNAAQQSGTTGGRAGAFIGKVEYRLARSADLVGVITPRFRDVLVNEGGVRTERIIDVPLFTHITGVDETTAAARARLGWPNSSDFLVVHTGNMGMKQGLENVVDAARIAHQRNLGVSFVLVGDGNQRRALGDLGKGIPNLRFVDPVDGDSYPHVLAAADALLLNERRGVLEMSLPSKVTSYVAARRPIIAAVEFGGITHSVVDEFAAAHVVDPGSGEALVAGALALRDDEGIRGKLVDAAVQMGEAKFGEAAGREGFRRFAKSLADTR